MGAQEEPNTDKQRRKWERRDYESPMTLVLRDGRRLDGRTLDASMGGVFLKLFSPIQDIPNGTKAELIIAPEESDVGIPCTVVRVLETGVGLNFSAEQATFGMFVTHDMLLDLLTSINNDFAVTLDLDTTLEISISHMKNYLDAEAASLFLVDADMDEIICKSCAGPVDITGMRLQMGEGIVGRCIQSATPNIVHDVTDESGFSDRVDDATGFKTQSILCAPLRIHNRTIGALEVINKRGSGLFTNNDRVVLTALASTTAMAIHNARQAQELLEKDALEEANKAKERFISSMSHELRTPLNAILGFTQLLTSDETAPFRDSDRELLDHILDGGKHLQTLINDLLDLAKIESGNFTIDLQETNTGEYIEECVTLANAMARENAVTIHDETQGQDVPTLLVDPTRFNQVILNLLSNAVKYNFENGTVKLKAARTDANMLRFSVTNTGPGIPPDKQHLIFTPFNRLGQEAVHQDGTGIGLTITKNLIELMGGSIGFESSPEADTTFWVEFSIAPTNT